MEAKEDLFHHRMEGIIAELSNYFEIRYQQITRIKLGLKSMYADLLWQQMAKVREVISGEKMFGPVRVRVADILGSRDEAKRHAVMGPIDQSSILNELIPEQEEGAARRPGFLSVRTMRALYTSVDPSLGPVIELTDIWLWWDILDATDIFNSKEQKKLIERLKGAEITASVQNFYHGAMGRRDDRPLTRDEILSFEFVYLESLWKNFMQRRAEEKSYMMVIKREPIGGEDSVDELIVTLSRHITARQRLGHEGGLDDRLREYYAKVLKCEAAQVKGEQAIAHEDLAIIQLRDDLRMGLERGEVLGAPYDYKHRQGEDMGRDVEAYRQSLPLVKAVVESAQQRAAVKVGSATPSAPTATPSGAVETRRVEPKAAPKPELAMQEAPSEEGPIYF
jgi:hypothetical protein